MPIEEKVLERITPNARDRDHVAKVVSILEELVAAEIRRRNLDLELRLVGSVAKDTYLKNPDIDMFIMFPPATSRKTLETVGLGIGKRVLKGEEHYAEHPYIRGSLMGLEVDLVPCYKIESPVGLKSAVDRTPFHTEYVRRSLREKQKAEVRLLKQFAKAIGVYGAEAKTQGFSGYLIELLVLRYGEFRSTLEEASKWRYGQKLCLESHSEASFDTPLVFYDPVDPKRNVSSALSVDSFSLFIYAAGRYLSRPSIRFFFPRKRKIWTLQEIRKEMRMRGSSVLTVEFQRPDLVDDDLYPQIRKTLEGLKSLLESHDFVVFDRVYSVDGTVRFIIELQDELLPGCRRHVGPPVWMKNAEEFLNKWGRKGTRRPFIDNGRWVVIAGREFSSAADLVRNRIGETSLGQGFKGKKGLRILDHKSSLTSDRREALTLLLDKKKPWEF